MSERTSAETLAALDASVEEAARALKSAQDVVSLLRRDLQAAQEAAAAARFGVSVGSLVRNPRGEVFEVTAIEFISWMSKGAKPWLSGRKLKKDGKPSASPCRVYGEWEVVE